MTQSYVCFALFSPALHAGYPLIIRQFDMTIQICYATFSIEWPLREGVQPSGHVYGLAHLQDSQSKD